MSISNDPYIGCIDYLPKEFNKLKYILDTWRKVAQSYGFEEYLTPVLEYLDLYTAKSGEDISKEVFKLVDSGGRDLVLRPEMTPSVTRLVTKIYNSWPKPIKLFSIANFFRGEKPQKGRYREFWQLNMDIFGSNSIYSDLEILLSAIDIMNNFKAPKETFVIKINHRKLIDFFLEKILNINSKELKINITRKLDKFNKLSLIEFKQLLNKLKLNSKQIDKIVIWLNSDFQSLVQNYPQITENIGFKDINYLIETLNKLGYTNIIFSNSLIRGFDYYDGMIFEIFDSSNKFNRSLFGGGRYNGLAEIFGENNIPAVGFAPGSPISIFLDNWNLWPESILENQIYFLPILAEKHIVQILNLAQYLRNKLMNIQLGDKVTTISKSLDYANKKGLNYVIIYGEDEIKSNEYIIKNMKTGQQKKYKLTS